MNSEDEDDLPLPPGGPTDQYELALSMEYRFVYRWGEDVLKMGFTTVPNLLMRINRFVPKARQLKSSEIFVLITLLSYWWDNHRMPFPSMSRLSFETGLSVRQTKRVISQLSEKGYFQIKKLPSKNVIESNQYDLTPLVELAKKIAKHEVAKGLANPKSRFSNRLRPFPES